MRLIVNADGVRALVEIDPEHTIELAKNAAAQVSNQLARQIHSGNLEKRFERIVDNLCVEERKKLTDFAKGVIHDAVKEKVDVLVDMKTNPVVFEEIRTTIRAIMAKSEADFIKDLSGKIDALIKQRFAAAFGVNQ